MKHNFFIFNKRILLILILLVNILLIEQFAPAQQRFPKPEFDTGHVQPQPQSPLPRSPYLQYLDIFVLALSLSLASYFAIKKRSRKALLYLSVFSLLYFGFYREGCVCAVGSIQNISLALFDSSYSIPIAVVAFFVIPLIFTLFFGRTFCASVCPLGAIQDIVIIKPLKINIIVDKLLSLIPYIYLAFAILYAATGSAFLICRYDPFVSFFRFDGTFDMLVLGGCFLIAGIFVARPYCRFLCPYGVLLGWMSKLSKWHLSITPNDCVQCKLCENSCPFDVIEVPQSSAQGKQRPAILKKSILFTLLIPVWVAAVAISFQMLHPTFARLNPKVNLALQLQKSTPEQAAQSIDLKTFQASGQTLEQLHKEVHSILESFSMGSLLIGAFIGLIIGLFITRSIIPKENIDYVPNKVNCFSCGRCIDYCPVGKQDFDTGQTIFNEYKEN